MRRNLRPIPLSVILSQPTQVRALLLCPGLHNVDHRMAHRPPQPPISLCVFGKGVNHLLVVVQPS
jgi:hypothetical protein